MKKCNKHIVITWSILALVFILFLSWNGAFNKPLTQDEVNHYIEKLSDIKPAFNEAMLRNFLENDDGKPVIMVNVIKLYDTPQPIDGVEVFETSEDALSDYISFVLPYLLKRGSYPIFNGATVYDSLEVWGIDDAKEWTTGALMRYRSRRVLIEMSTDPVFDKFHDSKKAAIEKTFAFPVSLDIHLFDPAIVVGLLLAIIGLAITLVCKTNYRT